MHHFVSCVVGGVLLVWPDGPTYRYQRRKQGGGQWELSLPGFVKSLGRVLGPSGCCTLPLLKSEKF